MTNRPLLMAVLSALVLTSTVFAAAGPAFAGSTTDESTQLDVGVELEQEETVTRGGDVSVSAYLNERAGQPRQNATVSLLVDTDDDGTVEASEAVTSQEIDLAADEHREVEFTYANVQLSPGQYAYAARVTHDNRSTRSYSEGTLTVTAAEETAASDANVSRICFEYGQYGGNINLQVNGQQLYTLTRLDAAPPNGIDGATIGGANVSVTSSPVNGGRTGHVEITGEIEQFRVGGQELYIDTVEFGPNGSPKSTVQFNYLSPSKSTYSVGDYFSADGVSIVVHPFIYSSGTATWNGKGLYQTAPPAMSGGVAPEFYPNNVNLAFDISSAVNTTNDGEREEMAGVSCGDGEHEEQEEESKQEEEHHEDEQKQEDHHEEDERRGEEREQQEHDEEQGDSREEERDEEAHEEEQQEEREEEQEEAQEEQREEEREEERDEEAHEEEQQEEREEEQEEAQEEEREKERDEEREEEREEEAQEQEEREEEQEEAQKQEEQEQAQEEEAQKQEEQEQAQEQEEAQDQEEREDEREEQDHEETHEEAE